jgi:hypothetical protein
MSQREGVEKVRTDLEIDEQLPRQIRGWKVQSVGLIFIFALLFSAAIGLFGDGVVSKRKASQASASIEYERFFRHDARMNLKVEASNPDNRDVVVSFPTSYLQKFNVESIVPEPAMNKTQNGYVNYVFEGDGAMQITFYFIPQETGKTHGTLRVNDEEFIVNHFIYP